MTIEDTLERIAALLEKIAENTGSPEHVARAGRPAAEAEAPKRGPGRPRKNPEPETPPDDDAGALPEDGDGTSEAEIQAAAEAAEAEAAAAAEAEAAEEAAKAEAAEKAKAAKAKPAAGKPAATTPNKAQAQAIVEKRVECKMKFKALLALPGGRPKAQELLKWLKVEVISAVPDAKLDDAIGAIKRALAAGQKAGAGKA